MSQILSQVIHFSSKWRLHQKSQISPVFYSLLLEMMTADHTLECAMVNIFLFHCLFYMHLSEKSCYRHILASGVTLNPKVFCEILSLGYRIPHLSKMYPTSQLWLHLWEQGSISASCSNKSNPKWSNVLANIYELRHRHRQYNNNTWMLSNTNSTFRVL